MRYTIMALLALTLVWAVPGQARDMREMAKQVTNPIVIKGGESSLMDVTFKHTSHKGVSCVTCHHKKSEKAETRYLSCKSCHVKPGAKERGPKSMFMAYHAKKSMSSCYGCHSKKRAEQPEKYAAKFNGCRPCHTGPMAAK